MGDSPHGTTGTGETMYGWRIRGIETALHAQGLADGPLTVGDLTALGHLDQYHYYGTAACDEAARVLGLDGDRRLLDVGSGVGGPARYLAAETGCSVHGVEIREPLVEMARRLTDRVGLADRVEYTAGDATTVALPADAYDHAVAWLVVLHVPEPGQVLENCRHAICPGGTLFIEALVADEPSPAHRETLREVVEARTIQTRAELVSCVEAAGFVDTAVCDLTEPWTRWTDARYEQFRDERAQFVDLHGQATYERRARFYRAVRDLFAENAVGGVRLTARVPGGDPLSMTDREQTALDDCDPAAVLEG